MSRWVWMLGIPAALVAAGTFVTVTWPSFGWETPKTHAADFSTVTASIAATAAFSAALEQRLAGQINEAKDAVQQQIKESQDEYRCDKYRADVREFRRQLQQRPNDVDLADEILRIEQRMGVNGLNCARFDV